MRRYTKYSGYRALTSDEISRLSVQNCRAGDWNAIKVAEKFSPENIHNCFFKGTVMIGSGVYINSAARIENMAIGDRSYIEGVGAIEVTGETSFGNGVKAAVINEAGGREVPLFAGLTAQIAYLAAIYRNRAKAVAAIEAMAVTAAENARDALGAIGSGAKITDCKTIRNMDIGAGTILEGADILCNGTINSSEGQHTFIGAGVKMYDFVMSGGSSVSDGAILKNCFVGQAVKISGLTANDSLFFANSDVANGEFCNVFAGPFTVSHHASSLLIAGMFSFFNGGSAMNQSNHLFKAGPVHQGIHQRGCKYGSGAYMMLPSLDGAFTTVIGKHKSHPDTEDFPYSYLIEENGASYILPAMNIGTAGNARDIAKWKKRDKRDGTSRDYINFEECNPFVAERIIRAIDISERLLAKHDTDIHHYNRVKIKSTMLRRGLNLYKLAYDKFIGEMLSYRERPYMPGICDGTGGWIDAAGMFMPRSVMKSIIIRIETGELDSPESLYGAFEAAHANYQGYARNWALSMLEKELGRKAAAGDISGAIEKGRAAAEKLARMAEEDERKDFSDLMAVSYGLDASGGEEKTADFRAVHGLD